jgi:O-antigen/teichoic acid export membrane protein
MNTLRRAVRNVLAQLGSQAVTWTATFVFTAVLGRSLGDRGFGVLFLALAFTGMFGVLVEFGMQPLVAREVARQPELISRYLWHGMAIKGVLWVLSFIAIQVCAVVLDYPSVTRVVLAIYTVTMGFTAAHRLFQSAFTALERLGPPSVATIIEKVSILVLGVAVLAAGRGVIAVAWVLLAGAAANLCWQLLFMWPQLRIRIGLDLAFARRLVAHAAPLAVYGLIFTLYWRIDAVMLSAMASEEVIGWYGAAYRLFESLLFLPAIVAASVMLPLLSRLSRESREGMHVAFEKGLNVLLVAGIPISAGLVVAAGPLIGFVYGPGEFDPAASALRILGAGVLVLYINSAVGWALLSLDMERQLLLIPVAAGVLNIALNLFMIPRWQHTGAALATVLSECVIGVMFFWMLPRWLRPWRSLAVAGRASLAAAGMCTALVLARHAPVPVLVLVGAAVYVALALLFQVVPREDLRMLRRAVRRGAAAAEPV